MKILRNDATGVEARQSSLGSIIFCTMFLLAGIGIVVLMATKSPGVVAQNASAGYIVGVVFALVGVLGILFSRTIHVLADKSSATVSISYRSLVIKKEVNVNFADVARITEESTVVGSSGSTTQVTQLLLKDGTAIPIPVQRGGFAINGLPIGLLVPHTDLGRALAAAIGVPFEPLGFGSVSGTMNAVGEAINAVKLSQGKAPTMPIQVEQPASSAPSTPVVPTTPAVPPAAVPQLPETKE